VWLFAMSACFGPSYDSAMRADTIEAYEAFLAADPDSPYLQPSEKRLEELYYEKAVAENSLAGWEVYTTRWALGGAHHAQGLKKHAAFAWKATLADGSPEALRAYLEKFSKADQVLAARATGMLAAHDYGKLELSEPRVEPINLAEDPKGEKNGWGVSVDVKNAGDQTFAFVRLTVEWQAADGTEIVTRDYPLVSDHWNVPATEAQQTPLKPGDERTWQWTEDYSVLPAGTPPKAKVYPSGLRVLDEDKEKAKP
jgi:hypothetical protein